MVKKLRREREYAWAIKYKSYAYQKDRVNVKLPLLVHDLSSSLNREFDFIIRMETNRDTNELKQICQKN